MRQILDGPCGFVDELFLRVGVGLAATAVLLAALGWQPIAA